MTHYLKTHPEPFKAVYSGRKTAEFRKDDRGFEIGDWLVLEEWDPSSESYSRRAIVAHVTDITTGFGIPEGHVMMSFHRLLISETVFHEAMRKGREKALLAALERYHR